MRVACLQLNPAIGKLQQNILKANTIIDNALSKLDRPFDLLILPELALTGYNFPNRAAIEPFLEQRETGPTSKWATEISKRNKCFTLVGFPEWDAQENKIFNSAVLTGPDGSMIHHYRKTFLYESDENWGCSENPSKKQFEPFELIINKDYYLKRDENSKRSDYKLIVCNIGICMDLNPYKFEAPFNKFEFSLSCFQNRAELILCPMAWLSPKSPSLAKENESSGGKESESVIEQSPEVKYDLLTSTTSSASLSEAQLPEMSTVDYWVLRFLPFLKHTMVDLPRYYKNVTLICCNRSGKEDDVLYGGSSLIFQFNSDAKDSMETGVSNDSVKYFGSLGTAEEGIIIRDIDI